jgi:hypothetical protein
MCEHAAAILTRTDVHWCETDSHTHEIERLGLRDDGARSPDFVRVEITPPDKDFSQPLSEWRYHVDQDSVPDWYEPRSAEAAVRDALPAWVATHVVLPDQHRDEITSGLVVAIYGHVDSIGGSAHVDSIGDSAHVNWISGSAHVNWIGDSAHVNWIGDSAHVNWIGDSAHVDSISGSTRVYRICNSAHIDSISGSAHIDSIYGSAHVDSIGGSAHVDSIGGSAHVDSIGGSACIHAYAAAACSAELIERGHIVDMRGAMPRIIVAATEC